ncbi:Aminobutyraldehyde dehydrogenase [Pseudoalteromonas luteoviolacea B = ATCC 29581]|nr:Aminobutyraldehyde dehydrogenase [Pseudoalteromonas luteoviolacea B = ATCC 29581]
MEFVDTIVVGAGCVGLAIGAKLASSRSVLVVESEAHIGEHTSSRNSEVIHAGIYYPSTSLKAQLCVRGKALLYDFCQSHTIPYLTIGKVIVASNEKEQTKLHEIIQQAQNNQVNDLIPLTSRQLSGYAPDIKALSGVYSPSTGIIDSHYYMLALQAEIERHQGLVVRQTKCLSATPTPQGFAVELESQGEPIQLACRQLINAAGHGAQTFANKIEGLASSFIPEQHFCKGVYFRYHGKHPFKHLIYPIPEQHGLGVHATLDLAGQLKFGPDTEFVSQLNYDIDANKKPYFVEAIKRYWPNLDPDKLYPDYAGIRPKTCLYGFQDFQIQDETTHHIHGLVNLFGIESPGLTASLAIAERLEKQLA